MLAGRTVLVVEAEFLIALDIQRMIEGFGAGQMLFARNALEATGLVIDPAALGLAIIEVRSDQPLGVTLTQRLVAEGVPVVLLTVNTMVLRGHPELPGVPVILKPIAEADLLSAVDQALKTP